MKRQHAGEWFTLAGVLLFAGIFLGTYHALAEGKLVSFDGGALAYLKGFRAHKVDIFFLELTALGSVTVLTLLSLSAVALLYLDGRARAATQLLLAATLSSALSQSIKLLVERPRPPLADRLDLVSGYSFPSGHASSGAAIYLTFALLLLPKFARARARNGLLALSLLFVLLLGFSRAYLAVHYPSDVLGGLCLGSGIALLVHLILNPRSAWHVRKR